MKKIFFFLILGCLILMGCKDKKITSHQTVYPVKFVTMQVTEPSRIMRLTGSARAWRQESLAFEVSGRLKSVIDENADVDIFSQPNADGSFNVVGQIVAELDSSRYDADVAIAQAALVAAKEETKATEIAVNQIVPQDIRSAQEKVNALEITLHQILPSELNRVESQLTLAKQEFGRAKDLYDRNAGTKQMYDQAQNQLESATSVFNQVKGNILTKEKELASAQAELAKAHASLFSKKAQFEAAKSGIQRAQAQLTVALKNQEDCKLRTPFSGIVSSRLATIGAVVGPQRPVVVVTMMDPINIEVSVSAEMARNMQPGDPVEIFPNTLGGKSIKGWVERKSVAADPSTRTYLISCIGRNQVIPSPGSEFQKNQLYLTKEDVAMVWEHPLEISNILKDEKSLEKSKYLMVWTKSIQKDEQGYYAWTLKDFKLGKEKMRPQKLTITRSRFELGTSFKSYVQREYREVVHPQNLENLMVTFRNDFPNLKEGLELNYMPTDWMIRPGDLLQVSFDLGMYPKGIYVPISTIFNDEQNPHIFIHENGIAKRINVKIYETFREERRVVAYSLEGKEISLEGKELITQGAHYIRDNDKVIASRQGGK